MSRCTLDHSLPKKFVELPPPRKQKYCDHYRQTTDFSSWHHGFASWIRLDTSLLCSRSLVSCIRRSIALHHRMETLRAFALVRNCESAKGRKGCGSRARRLLHGPIRRTRTTLGLAGPPARGEVEPRGWAGGPRVPAFSRTSVRVQPICRPPTDSDCMLPAGC